MKQNFFGSVTEQSIIRRKVLYFLLIVVVFGGYLTYSGMTKSIFPTVKFPYVSVSTTMVGASPEDIETMVTNPIENALKDLQDIRRVTSTSSGGHSLVVLQFHEGVDGARKVQEIQSRISNISEDLPNAAQNPIVEEYDLTRFPIIAVEVDGDKPYKQVRTTIDALEKRIKAVEGVKNIEIAGLNVPYIVVAPDVEKMKLYGIDHDTIINTVRDNNFNLPLGTLELEGMAYTFETDNRVASVEDIRDVTFILSNGKSIQLSDIADVSVKEGNDRVKNYRMKDGQLQEIIGMMIFKDKAADSIAINREIKSIIETFNNESEMTKVHYSMDSSKYITKSISDVVNNALGGLLSVIVVLFLFINLREALIASVVIPITLVSSLLLFDVFGLTLNVLSIMGLIIALGMLVDNAIVVIEMIDERRSKHKSMSMMKLVVEATGSVAPAIFSSTVTTICAFIPLAFLSGAEGSLIRVIPIATAIAMSISFLVSITVTPVLAYQFLDRGIGAIKLRHIIGYMVLMGFLGGLAFTNNWQPTLMSFVAAIVFSGAVGMKFYLLNHKENRPSVFRTFIHKIIHSKLLQFLVIFVMIIMMIVTLELFTSGAIRTEAMPRVDSQNITGRVTLIRGTTIDEATDIAETFNRFLDSKDYMNQYSYTLSGEQLNYAIELKPNSERDKHSTIILNELSSYITGLPDVKGSFVVEGEESGASPVVVQLFNDDQDILFEDVKKLHAIFDRTEGVLSPEIDFDYGPPTASIKIDKEAASRLKVDLSTIVAKLRYLIAEERIMTVKIDDINTRVLLRHTKPFETLSEIGGLTVYNRDGLPIGLEELIAVEEERPVSELLHFDSKKMMSVSSGFREGFTVTEIIQNIENELETSELLDRNTTYRLAGDYVTMQESYSDLTNKFLIALMLVYIVLLLQFNSILQPIAIILSVPFSIIGVALGYYFTGLTFSTLSFLGIVSLVGIAVNDAIVLIDYINTLRKEHGYGRLDAIVEGCCARFKPIIATSLTTMAGVAPLAFYSEDYSQMAYALIYGLVGSTVLTLIVVPTFMNIFEGIMLIFKKDGEVVNEAA